MQHYAISATRDGFRRAGRTWSREVEVVPAGEISEAQLEALRADPNITVTPCAADGPAPAAAGDAAQQPSPAEVARAMSVEELRATLIHVAMRGLEPANADHFTAAGLPVAAALQQATGLRSISAAVRDEIWPAVQAERAAAES